MSTELNVLIKCIHL